MDAGSCRCGLYPYNLVRSTVSFNGNVLQATELSDYSVEEDKYALVMADERKLDDCLTSSSQGTGGVPWSAPQELFWCKLLHEPSPIKGVALIVCFKLLVVDEIQEQDSLKDKGEKPMASVALISASPGIECADISSVDEPIDPDVMLPSMEELLMGLLDSNTYEDR
ncbi:hypothetical protein CRG98_034384 [Punica granatum]|uniref:Uncharacterized protein n=1 Tax=Punica granatum TaxID=22663 RepID=A0A2I0IP48_PUNGR|nr:hypothetical protein CRG98_034384 [Punica granatum]